MSVVESRRRNPARRFLLELELAAELLMLALEELVAAEAVDRAVARRDHSHAPGLVRNTGLWQRSRAATSASCASSSEHQHRARSAQDRR